MLAIDTVDAPPVAPEPIPETLRDIEPIDVTGATQQKLEFTIALDGRSVVMGFNGVPYGSARSRSRRGSARRRSGSS